MGVSKKPNQNPKKDNHWTINLKLENRDGEKINKLKSQKEDNKMDPIQKTSHSRIHKEIDKN